MNTTTPPDQTDSAAAVGIMFVCLGNICRSPSAEAICRHKALQRGWQHKLRVDSTGTAGFNAGKPPDARAVAAAARAGYSLEGIIARQITPADYASHQYILVMDRVNLSSVKAWAPPDYSGVIELLMPYSGRTGNSQIADPYYAEAAAFDAVIATLEEAVDGLLDHLGERLAAS